jgi:hypothetical protein
LKLSTPVENEDLKLKLANRGIEIGIYKTASLMKKANIIAIKPKKRLKIFLRKLDHYKLNLVSPQKA